MYLWGGQNQLYLYNTKIVWESQDGLQTTDTTAGGRRSNANAMRTEYHPAIKKGPNENSDDPIKQYQSQKASTSVTSNSSNNSF